MNGRNDEILMHYRYTNLMQCCESNSIIISCAPYQDILVTITTAPAYVIHLIGSNKITSYYHIIHLFTKYLYPNTVRIPDVSDFSHACLQRLNLVHLASLSHLPI